MERYLGIDLGTSGCRAIIIDEAESVVAQSAASLPASIVQGLHVTQDPSAWWAALTLALSQLAAQADLKQVAALSIDGTSGSLLAVDAQGEPMGPALMYDDSGCVLEADQIALYAPMESPARGRTSGLAKWLWLKKHYPKSRIIHQADWLAARLGAKFMTSDENNALKTGYDPVSRAWPRWLENLVDINELLCIVPPGTYLGICESPQARVLRLNPDTLVMAGTTDSVAAFIASGAQEIGDAVTSLGSTLTIKLISASPVYAAEFGVYSHRLGDLWLVGGASNTGGAALLPFFSVAEMEALSAHLKPDEPTGLDYYPLTKPGERFPIADPTLAPRLTPRPAQDTEFFQGLLESIARIEAQGYARLAQLGATPVRTLRTLGGGARNTAWSRIRSRLLQVPMPQAMHLDAAYGSALLAKRGIARYRANSSSLGN
ncbi:MAG: FGGY-family carbohydrate kinase [Pseudomonadota bacterium]